MQNGIMDFVGAAQAGVNTNRYPWSTIVHLEVHYDYDGKADDYGSGVMIGTNDVLTAAHVIYNPALGVAKYVYAIPAWDEAAPKSSPTGHRTGRLPT